MQEHDENKEQARKPYEKPQIKRFPLRPEEAVSLRRDNLTLPALTRNPQTGDWEEPADNWGELQFSSAAPEAGAEWTDDGQIRDHRHLKSRPVDDQGQIDGARQQQHGPEATRQERVVILLCHEMRAKEIARNCESRPNR